ncbi:hypothetical protein B0H21DRAFT_878690 [Amylocystis lapponica]|nr:hypothetical protein B0H21DRAFT_878690 [Amylocystis lapponica]
MHSTSLYLYVLSGAVLCVRAGLYVNDPVASTTCNGGQPCTVTWLDDGSQPLLSGIGACYVGLYNGNNVLVQQIEPVDVASVHSLQFTPDPGAGPDSGTYYINFTAINPVDGARYIQYSAFFTMASMSGSFVSPIASDTSTLSVPSTVLSPPPNSVITPTASGSSNSGSSASIPTSSLASTSAPSSSGMTTSRLSGSSSSSSPSPSTSTSSATARWNSVSPGVLVLFLATGILSCVSFL